MRLFITAPSPYVRKCRIVIREKGLTDRVQEVTADPYANDPDLVAANPIAQAPALLTDDGQAFADSPLICAYLDSIGTGPKLIPEAATNVWTLRLSPDNGELTYRLERHGKPRYEATFKLKPAAP